MLVILNDGMAFLVGKWIKLILHDFHALRGSWETLDQGHAFERFLAESLPDVVGITLVVLNWAMLGVQQEVHLGIQSFDSGMLFFEHFVGDVPFVVV